MAHQFEQALGVVRSIKVILVERGCAGGGAALEPEIGIVAVVETIEAPAPPQRARVATAKAFDIGPHGDAASGMTGEDEVLDGEGFGLLAVASCELLPFVVQEIGETLEHL